MRILYVVQYFNLPHEPGGSRPYQFARAWAKAGHEVTVLTGAVNHKTLSVDEKYRGRLAVSEKIDGIRVLRVWSYAGIRGSFKKRLLNFLSFAFCAALAGIVRAGKADLIYASSTPLTVGIPGFLLSRIRRVPFVFEVRDLWPESAVALGVLRRKSLPVRLATRLSAVLYRRAKRVVALTRGIARGVIAHKVDPEKVLFVPNGVDDWMVQAGEKEVSSPPDGVFRVVYVGAHGRANCLGTILDAARRLADETHIEFAFYGDGDEREKLAARAKAEGLDRVVFHGSVAKHEAFLRLREGSASIVTTWDNGFQKMVLANKIFDYLAAGRPVLASTDSEMADLVNEARCGLVTKPENAEELAEAIRRLAAMSREERDAMGSRGRLHVLEKYQRSDLAWKLLETFAELTGREANGETDQPVPRLIPGGRV